MKNRIVMEMELLKLIMLVQSFKQYKSQEISLLGNVNKEDVEIYTQEYYNNLPEELLAKYNLKKNLWSFEKVLHYKVTTQMMNVEESELRQYEF